MTCVDANDFQRAEHLWERHLEGVGQSLGSLPNILGIAKFNHVAVGVRDVNLPGAIGSGPARQVGHSDGLQMGFPSVHVIDAEGEVGAAIVGVDGLGASSNEMKFLEGPKTKPGSGEFECRSGYGLQEQDTLVKITTLGDVRDMQGHVIQLQVGHSWGVHIGRGGG
jgi:hypothetical protein